MAAFLIVGHCVCGLIVFAPKLINLKTALINIKMNIPLFKIGRAGLPNCGFGVQGLNRLPCAVADTFAMLIGQGKKNFQMVAVGFLINFKYHAADLFAARNDAVGFALRVINRALNGFAGNNFTVSVNMVVSLAKLL